MALSKTGRFLSKAEIKIQSWGWGSFLPFQFPPVNKALKMSGRISGENCRENLRNFFSNFAFSLYRANGRGGFGSRTGADPSWGTPPKVPKKQTVGTVTASHKMLTPCKHFRALSMLALQREAFWAKERLLGDLRQSVPPKRPRPFEHYRFVFPETSFSRIARTVDCRELDCLFS